jgi:hypothetical protein
MLRGHFKTNLQKTHFVMCEVHHAIISNKINRNVMLCAFFWKNACIQNIYILYIYIYIYVCIEIYPHRAPNPPAPFPAISLPVGATGLADSRQYAEGGGDAAM